MMKLICIRHTRVDVRPGTCYGQTDVPLAASYEDEMAAVARQLDGIRIDAVFCSPLSRCRQLAGSLFPRHEIHLDERLKELHFGDWEQKDWEEIFCTDEGRYWMDHYLEAPCPGGESYQEFRERVRSFLDDLPGRNTGNIALVTHGGVIRLVKSILENRPMEDVFAAFNPVFGGIYS
ncbi:MAG: alpha-ribazole phosphatase [Mangrovibacterium sp.]|nr:alpha-ribazole phosphatase [Mangrovibacterium sp.]